MEIRIISLKEYSSLRVGGEGKVVSVKNEEEIKEALMHAKSEGLRMHLLGGGTNSYFGTDLSKFLFLQLDCKGITFADHDDSVLVTAQASEIWDDLVRVTVERGLWGIENLSLIPGTVGAAPVQNIGAYGVELKDVFVSVTALDTETMTTRQFTCEESRFGYRDSFFKHAPGRYIITSVSLLLSKVKRPVLTYKPLDVLSLSINLTPQDVRDVVVRTRETKLPDWHENPNAGSFFKNPVVNGATSERLATLYPSMPLIETTEGYKIPAAWLIEHVAEMKGFRMGDMGTWPNQPLVLVNYGEASADGIDRLAGEIRNRIHEKTGIMLEQEVNRVG